MRLKQLKNDKVQESEIAALKSANRLVTNGVLAGCPSYSRRPHPQSHTLAGLMRQGGLHKNALLIQMAC